MRSVRGLKKLLNDFMKFARLRELDLEIGSLNEQVAMVLDMYEAQAQSQGVQINRYLDPELPAMQLNRRRYKPLWSIW